MDPLRLRQDGDDFERDLLGSAGEDRPAPGARERLLDALGVAGLAGTAAAIGLTASTAHAAGTGAAGATGTGAVAFGGSAATSGVAAPGAALAGATGAGASGATALGVATVSKWLGAGLLVGLGSTALVSEASAPFVAPAARPAVAVVVVERAAPATEGPAGHQDPPAGRAAVDKAAEAAPVTTASAPRSTVAEEIAAIDGIRAALRAGDGPAAERQLAAYRARFATGTLVPEADLLALEAVAARGDGAATSAAARAYLARHPRSPHAARARAILARTSPPARGDATAPSSTAPPAPPAATPDIPSGVASFRDPT